MRRQSKICSLWKAPIGITICLFIVLSLFGCADAETRSYQDLGAHVTTMKALNGTYLTNRDGHLLLLSGTEVQNQETSQVFLYDID